VNREPPRPDLLTRMTYLIPQCPPMTWTEKLKQFSGLGSASDRTETAALLPLMTGANGRLSKVSELAPTPVMHADVQPVVTRAEAVVQRVRDLLRDFGPAKVPANRINAEPDGHNHWARLLQALEQHREVRQRLREVTITVEDTDPTLSHALEDIGRAQDMVLEQLRNLIARADPQALN
jgi:hypothetical protein